MSTIQQRLAETDREDWQNAAIAFASTLGNAMIVVSAAALYMTLVVVVNDVFGDAGAWGEWNAQSLRMLVFIFEVPVIAALGFFSARAARAFGLADYSPRRVASVLVGIATVGLSVNLWLIQLGVL